jgi:hypothetical protein
LSGKPNAFHIEQLPTSCAQRRGLLLNFTQTIIANGNKPCLKQRSSTNSTVGWKQSCYKVIEDSPNHPSRPLKK